jgi:hypothetical protein
MRDRPARHAVDLPRRAVALKKGDGRCEFH